MAQELDLQPVKPLDVQPLDVQPVTPPPTSPSTEEEPGIIERAFTPLTEAPGNWLRDVAATIDEPALDRGRFSAQVRGFLAGALGGLRGGQELPLIGSGGLASEADLMASPAGIAGLAAKPVVSGVRGLSRLARGARRSDNIVTETIKTADGQTTITAPKADIDAAFGPVVDEAPTVVKKLTGEIAETPQARLVAALNKAEPLTKKQAKSYSEELRQRLATMMDEETPGIAGHFKRQQALSGRYARVKTRPLAMDLDGNDMDALADMIQASDELMPLQKQNATSGLLDLFSGRVPQPNRIRLLKQVFGGDFEEALIKVADRERGILGKTQDFMRSMITSNDFSGPGIQGRKFISYPEFWKSWMPMFRAWKSADFHKAAQESIARHPNFRPRGGRPSAAERAGLDLTDIIGNKEEKFRSRFAERFVPGVLRSERAYVTFLNKLRADMFNRLVKEAGEGVLDNDVVLKQIGDLINDATGRGSLGRWGNRHAELLNDTFFAPKLQAGRMRFWGRIFNPRFYMTADPVVRRAALRSLLTSTAFGITIGELGRLAGAQVKNDPTNADFRKMKIGDTRVDPMGGEAQYMTAAARLLTGKTTSSTSGLSTGLRKNLVAGKVDKPAGEFGGQTVGSVLTDFAANRLAPVPSMAVNLLFNRSYGDEDFGITSELADKVVPIMVQDIYELAQEDPSLVPLAIPAGTGLINVQVYGRD